MQYLFTVRGHRDINAYDSDEEMHAAFKWIGCFNQKLQDEDHWVMPGRPVSPKDAMTVPSDGSHSDLPYYDAMTPPSVSWIAQVADEQEAINLAREAVEVCAQAIEMRVIAE